MPTENNNPIKSVISLIVFGILWLIAAALFLLLLYLALVASYSILTLQIVKTTELLLVFVAIPIQFIALKKSSSIFSNVQQLRTNGAAFAKSLFVLVGLSLLSISILVAIVFIGCA